MSVARISAWGVKPKLIAPASPIGAISATVSASSAFQAQHFALLAKSPNNCRNSSRLLWSRLTLLSTATSGVNKRNRAVAFIDLGNEHIAPCPTRALANGASSATKFFITAPFMIVGSSPASVNIQPIMPVTVDLPLVPPTATLRGRGVEQFREQFGAGHALATQRVGFGDIGHAVLDCGGGDQDLVAADKPAAVLREQVDAKALQPFEFRSQPALIERSVRTRHRSRLRRGRYWRAATCPNRRCRRRNRICFCASHSAIANDGF